MKTRVKVTISPLFGTKVVDADTNKPIEGIVSLEISAKRGEIPKIQIVQLMQRVNVVGEAEVHRTMVVDVENGRLRSLLNARNEEIKRLKEELRVYTATIYMDNGD